ncbi:IS630 family transposase [Propioniciclava tarda]|uniref:IS630 family transposase n=1 Tax=Propioniciclava tarda TaxID=433330 RepID=A0A4Q9KJ71_PROTD|nr:IS630 family transposase [Propioniciclava tarda]TBT94344.1 IS630 family transposase [Propioniciclava tarda]SMO72277.1 Winged helix-turn helix [Propioniciclava tarda]
MANRPAPALVLREGDLERLSRIVRSTAERAGLVLRSRIVLLAAEGLANESIAERVGVARNTVLAWRRRYAQSGLRGLEDQARSGRPRRIDHRKIVSTTLKPPPKKYGVTHWSSRLLGKHLGIGNKTVAVAWREYGVQPWRAETFRFSTDPELVGKVNDVVGLYLNPPENAIVLCVDEKSQIQALDRTAPLLPIREGSCEKRTHDYVRHGTSTLFAALEIATGRVTGACKPRHRNTEFLAFLKQVARAYPDQDLHLVMDNYAAHKHPNVKAWLEAHPRVKCHFTPTHASWMNLVEVWFGIIERQAIHRGTFGSVKDLNAKIRAFITGWNDRCHPFVWTKTADQILKKAKRSTTSETPH